MQHYSAQLKNGYQTVESAIWKAAAKAGKQEVESQPKLFYIFKNLKGPVYLNRKVLALPI